MTTKNIPSLMNLSPNCWATQKPEDLIGKNGLGVEKVNYSDPTIEYFAIPAALI